MPPSGKAFKSQRGRRDHSRLRASVRAEDGVKVRVTEAYSGELTIAAFDTANKQLS